MPTLRYVMLAALGSVFLSAGSAHACEPCLSRSSLERTISQASAIVLVANNDRNSMPNAGEDGPELLELDVLKIYSGSVDTSTVLVHSWYGMCAYGVQMALNAKAVLMLQEVRDVGTGAFDGTYKLVESGCSTGQLEVRGDSVRVNERLIPLESFASKYVSR